MNSSAAELARRLVHAFGDPDAIGALLTDDAEWWITPTVGVLGSPSIGRASILESMRTIFGEIYEDLSVEVHHAVGDDEIGAVRITLRATVKVVGGKPLENEYSVWVRRAGDRIDRVWEYVDTAHATAQLQDG